MSESSQIEYLTREQVLERIAWCALAALNRNEISDDTPVRMSFDLLSSDDPVFKWRQKPASPDLGGLIERLELLLVDMRNDEFSPDLHDIATVREALAVLRRLQHDSQ